MFSSPISSREPSTRPLKCRCRPASLLPLLLTVLPVASAAWWDHRLPWLDRCRDEREVKRALALTDCEHDRHDFYRLLRLQPQERICLVLTTTFGNCGALPFILSLVVVQRWR